MKHVISFILAVQAVSCATPAEPNADAGQPAETVVDSTVARFSELVPNLMGDWTDTETEPGAIVHERWNRTDDAFYSGIGFVMVEKDTVFIEHLNLSTDSANRIAYKVRVPWQNEGGTVSFALTHCGGDSMVFENPAHDFPQRICYALRPDGDWTAHVSGPGKDGKPRSFRYRFKRTSAKSH